MGGPLQQQMLSRGEYLGGLYDIGFDRPEAHAIRKSGKMFYAFFAPMWRAGSRCADWEPSDYRIVDYENERELGTVHGPAGTIDAQFEKHLLIRAEPNSRCGCLGSEKLISIDPMAGGVHVTEHRQVSRA